MFSTIVLTCFGNLLAIQAEHQKHFCFPITPIQFPYTRTPFKIKFPSTRSQVRIPSAKQCSVVSFPQHVYPYVKLYT